MRLPVLVPAGGGEGAGGGAVVTAIGGIAAVPSYAGILWRSRTRLDDALDVVAAHGLAGIVGALLTGVFAERAWGATADGLLAGNAAQVGVQALALVAVSFGLLRAIALVTGLRPSARDEGRGLDLAEHGEEAYAQGEGAILVLDSPPRPVSVPVPATA